MVVFSIRGHDFEEEFFGQSSADIEQVGLVRRFRRGRIRSLKKELRRVKSCQSFLGWNPREPKTRLARCLFDRVQSRLIGGGRDLRLFMTIGTKVDFHLGVDGFFEFKHRLVTIDLTVNPHKIDAKADVIVTRDHFIRDEHYQLGDLIAKKLSYIPRF